MAGFAEALKLWETNIRLFTAAGGKAPEGDAQRIAFIKLLPPSVAAHVTLYADNQEFSEYTALKRFALRYIKIMMGLDAQRATTRPLKLVEDAIRHLEGEPEREAEEEPDACEDAADTLDIPGFAEKPISDQVEIFAFMKAKGFTPAGRGVSAGLCAGQAAEVRVQQPQVAEQQHNLRGTCRRGGEPT